MNITSLKLVALVFLFATLSYNSYGGSIEIQVQPVGSSSVTNSAVITLNGNLYAENIWLEEITAGRVQVGSDESFIARVVATNQSGTASDILNTWNPDEREQMGSYINNPTLFAKNQQWYQGVKNSAFLARIHYGEYIIFLVQHTMHDSTNTAKLYPVKLLNGNYFMTNLLYNDSMYVSYMFKVKELIAFKVKPQ